MMEIEGDDFKNAIIPKIKKSTEDLVNNKHSRVLLSDFNSIQKKKVGHYYAFYNKIYKNVSKRKYNKKFLIPLQKQLDFFNEEEDTDFLMFENNKVYIDYNDNLFNFHKVDDEEKIIEVDLDNCEIKGEKDKDENAEDEIDTKTDLVTLNYFPICISHCNITLCYEQDLPQVLSNELIVQFMNIYQIADNKSLICGYDSLGAGCVINQLHFEFLMLDDFFNEINKLPLEEKESKPIFETKLKYKKENEISMFDGTTLIKVSKIEEPFVCWKIEAKTNKEENSDISAMENLYQNSLSYIANLILSKLIDKEIPHNIILTNQGKIFYLIPRKFEDRKQIYNSCWNDLAGLITCKEEKTYEEINEENINKFFKDEISLEKNEFDKLNEDILNQIDSAFEITKFQNNNNNKR